MSSTTEQYDNLATHEENYLGYEIYIEPNPDPYREGFSWTVCRNDEEFDGGLEFDFEYALMTAKSAVHELKGTVNKPCL